MSVLIKGMEKPEHCGYCRFRYDGICHALQKTQYSMNECPLVVIDDAGLNDTISRQAERKKGEWVYGEKDGADGWYCSKCGFHIPWDYDYYGLNNIDFIRDFHTCPHCDAKMLKYTGMDGEENG